MQRGQVFAERESSSMDLVGNIITIIPQHTMPAHTGSKWPRIFATNTGERETFPDKHLALRCTMGARRRRLVKMFCHGCLNGK